MDYTIQTEKDLIDLIGQPESSRLEFKSSEIFLGKAKEAVVELLSKEISALANSEGGQIVIGLKERKDGKTRVADDIDVGIDPSVVAPEWVQQLVDSNLSPYLPGIKVRRVTFNWSKIGAGGIGDRRAARFDCLSGKG